MKNIARKHRKLCKNWEEKPVIRYKLQKINQKWGKIVENCVKIDLYSETNCRK